MNTPKNSIQIYAAFSLALLMALVGWRTLSTRAADGDPIAPEPVDVDSIENRMDTSDQEPAVDDPLVIETGQSDPQPTQTLSDADAIPASGSNMPDCEDVGITLATFIKDVTIADGSSLEPGQYFTKTWRIQNVGTCTWNSAYQFVFARGDLMGGSLSQPLTFGHVPPGGMIDVSVLLKAPDAPGSYRGYWRFRDSQGGDFGLTSGGSVWVDIQVEGESSGEDSSSEAYSGYPFIEIVEVSRDQTVTIKGLNFPAQDQFNVLMNYYGTLGVNGQYVTSIQTGNGGEFVDTFQIPTFLRGQSTIAIRLESPYSGYYSYNWFGNY